MELSKRAVQRPSRCFLARYLFFRGRFSVFSVFSTVFYGFTHTKFLFLVKLKADDTHHTAPGSPERTRGTQRRLRLTISAKPRSFALFTRANRVGVYEKRREQRREENEQEEIRKKKKRQKKKPPPPPPPPPALPRVPCRQAESRRPPMK